MKNALLAGIASLALIVPAVAQTTPPAGTPGQTSPSPQMNRPAGPGSTTDTTRPATPLQQQTQSPSTTTPPATAQTPPSTTAPSVAQGSTGGAGPYMTAPMQGQFMVSNLMDRTVYGSDGNSLGDVNDVVMDSNGNIAAVVVGVGGFLGIGEKDVAVPFSRLQVVHQQARTGTSGTPSGAPATAPGQSTATAPAAGSTGMGGSAFWANFSDDARLVLNATREELRNAPTFRARGDRGTAGTTGTTGTGGTTGQPSTTR